MGLIQPTQLATARLALSPPVASDFEASLAIVSDPQTGRFLGGQTSAADHFLRFARNAGSWMLYGYGAFTLRRHGSEDVVGNCGVFHTWRDLGEDFDNHPEAGWILRHDQTGQGLAYEAMDAVLAWFDGAHGPRRIVCMIAPGNQASLSLAGKLGFAPLREAQLPDNERVILLERCPG